MINDCFCRPVGPYPTFFPLPLDLYTSGPWRKREPLFVKFHRRYISWSSFHRHLDRRSSRSSMLVFLDFGFPEPETRCFRFCVFVAVCVCFCLSVMSLVVFCLLVCLSLIFKINFVMHWCETTIMLNFQPSSKFAASVLRTIWYICEVRFIRIIFVPDWHLTSGRQ